MFKRKKNKPVKTGIHTPKFRNPTPPPPRSNPPTSGSNAQKPYVALFEREPKTSPGIILPNDICTITVICPYETPCGWCTKWDKKCDKKIGHNETITYLHDDQEVDWANTSSPLCGQGIKTEIKGEQ